MRLICFVVIWGLSSALGAQEAAYKRLLQNLEPEPTPEILLLGYRDQEQGQTYRDVFGPFVGPAFATLAVNFIPGRVISAQTLPYLASPQSDGFVYLQSAQRGETVTARFAASQSYPRGAVQSLFKSEVQLVVDSDVGRLKERIRDFQVTANEFGIDLDEAVSVSRQNGWRGAENPADTPRSLSPERLESYDETIVEDLAYLGPGWMDVVTAGQGWVGGTNPGWFFKESTSTIPPTKVDVDFAAQYTPAAWESLVANLRSRARDGFFTMDLQVFGQVMGGGYFEDRWNDRLPDKTLSSFPWKEPETRLPHHGVQFRVGRENGVVSLMASYSVDPGAQQGMTVLAPAGPLSQRLIAYNSFPLSWNGLKAIEPDLVDAFLSPARNLLVVVFAVPGKANRLKVIDVRSGKPLSILWDGAEEYTIPLLSQRVVMVDWATGGQNTDRWLNTLFPNP